MSVRRGPYDSIPELGLGVLGSGAAIDGSLVHEQHSPLLTPTSRRKMTWCDLIALLQSKNLMGFRGKSLGSGHPVGAGANFEVWRYTVPQFERMIYQTQENEILPLGTVVALKRIIPRVNQDNEVDLGNQKQLSALASEVRALTAPSLRQHENIVTLYGLIWENRLDDRAAWPTLVLEYCAHTLAEVLENPISTVRIDQKIQFGKDIGRGLFALHVQSIIHGDIKSENILLKVEGADKFIPKLADFTCALFSSEDGSQKDSNEIVWLGGTNPWRAPEIKQCVRRNGYILQNEAYGADLFSYGMLWWRMFHDNRDPLSFVLQRDRKLVSESLKEQLKAEGSIGSIAEEDILSKVLEGEAGPIIARLVNHMLNLKPSARLQRTANLLANYRFIDAEGICQYYMKMKFEKGGMINDHLSLTNLKDEQDLAPSLDGVADLSVSIRELAFVDCLRLHNDEQRDEFRGLGPATKRRIFKELLSCVEDWERANNIRATCPGCCGLSRFDETPVPVNVTAAELLELLYMESMEHNCQEMLTEYKKQTQYGPISESLIFYRQIFTCYLEGYGVEKNINEGLTWLVKAARRGATAIQYDLTPIFHIFNRPPPKGLPLRKWMMYSVLFGSVGGSRRLLSMQEPFLYKIAVEARSYLRKGVDLSAIGRVDFDSSALLKEGNTKLHLACQAPEEQINVIEKLLGLSRRQKVTSLFSDRSSGYKIINDTNVHGETPLYLACRDQRPKVISFLLQKGADCSKANNAGITPLHWLTMMRGSSDLIEDVLCRGADVKARCSQPPSDYATHIAGLTSTFRLARRFGTPLQWAVAARNVEAVRILASYGADIDDDASGPSSLETAVFFANASLASALLESKPKSYIIRREVLYQIVWDVSQTKQCIGQIRNEEVIEVIQVLRPHLPTSSMDNINEFFKFTVVKAIRVASLPVLRAIIECLEECHSRFDNNGNKILSLPYWKDQELMRLCTTRNDPDILTFIIEQGVEPRRESLHHLADEGESVECAKVLLAHGCDITAKNHSGIFTPFAYAVLHGNTSLANFLRQNITVEQFACEISADAKLNRETRSLKGACTLLGLVLRYSSASESRLSGLEYLFSLPSHHHATDFITSPSTASSAFHQILDECNMAQGFFSQFNSSTVFRFLLTKFSDPQHINARDNHGMVPLLIAAWVAKLEECHMLVEAGADVNAVADNGRTPLDACFLWPPQGMQPNEDKFMPTREMIRRYEESKNEIAVFLRQKGALLGHEIRAGKRLDETLVPFPMRHAEKRLKSQRQEHQIYDTFPF
ncbi:MAG: hypothetical protein Q9167_005672 [Letrouitia subvulpina]